MTLHPEDIGVYKIEALNSVLEEMGSAVYVEVTRNPISYVNHAYHGRIQTSGGLSYEMRDDDGFITSRNPFEIAGIVSNWKMDANNHTKVTGSIKVTENWFTEVTRIKERNRKIQDSKEGRTDFNVGDKVLVLKHGLGKVRVDDNTPVIINHKPTGGNVCWHVTLPDGEDVMVRSPLFIHAD